MTYYEVNGLRYHTEISGSGPTLVLLHGFTGSTRNWRPLMAALHTHYQVIAVDLPGHGKTDCPADVARYEMAAAARDLTILLDDMDVAKPVLLGYSMGGRLALYTALHHPAAFSALILESASPGLSTATVRAERRASDNALADRIEREGLAAFVDYWERLPLWHTQERLSQVERARLRAQRLQNNPHGLANSLRGMGTGVQPSLWEHLGELRIPVRLIAGTYDEKFTAIARDMASAMPSASLSLVPRAGHTVHLEQPERYQAIVLEFLREAAH